MTAPAPESPATSIVLRGSGVALVLDGASTPLPSVLHFGADLAGADDEVAAALRTGAATYPRPNSFDDTAWMSLLPAEADGWLGPQGISGHRAGVVLLPRLVTESIEHEDSAATVVSVDERAGVSVRSELRIETGGLLRIRHTLTNTADGTLDVSAVSIGLPLTRDAVETLDLAGKWSRERSAQRHRLDQGTRLRETRRGRTGHDAPTVMVVGTAGFGFGHGRVIGVHLGWSGNSSYRAELRADPVANADGVLAVAELLEPGEIRLATGESYATPWAYFAWSDSGLDGLAHVFHRYLRSRPGHPTSPRPLVLNTWEAVYFDHDLDRLTGLADVAAEIGVERFVLDDGWFGSRRDDSSGLGDWYVSDEVWPDGLGPLFDHVRSRGMQVGLWFEPEMVNPDSDLARAHPDWILAAPGRTPMLSRGQQVLDLGRPEASAYLLERLDTLVTDLGIDFIKWDHNRDFAEPVHAPTGQYGVHRQTVAVYALLDELRRRHPSLEIESCSSGGARVDLGILDRADRVWASDSNDAVERQPIQRWTAQLIPLELIGAHVGPPVAHTSGRTVERPMREITALFGHSGFEWDIASCSPQERAELASFVALYKQLRGLLHTGDVVRADLPDDGAYLHGVVSSTRDEALFAYVRLVSSPAAAPGRVRIPGLDPDRRYDVTVRRGVPGNDLRAVPGSVLTHVGLQLPSLLPATAQLLHLTPSAP